MIYYCFEVFYSDQTIRLVSSNTLDEAKRKREDELERQRNPQSEIVAISEIYVDE